MKITGLKPVELAKGISAAEVAEFNLPLDFLLSNSVAKLNYQNLTGKNLPFQHPGFMTEDGLFPVKRFTVLKKGRRVSFSGIFLYNNSYELAEYLVKYYLPLSDTGVDSMIKRLKGKSPVKRLLSELIELFDKNEYPPVHRNKLDEGYLSWFPRLKTGDEWSRLDLKPYEVNGQKMFLRTIRRENRLWIWETLPEKGDGGVPRYSFILIRGRDEKAILWNGEKIEVKLPEFLEKKELADFESRGWIVASDKFDPLPRPELEVEFILRVPSREEAGNPDSWRFSRDKNPRARNPLFIFDLKRAIRVPMGHQVIMEPKKVLSILSRTKDNIYVPGDASYDLNPYLQEKPYFLAAMKIVQ